MTVAVLRLSAVRPTVVRNTAALRYDIGSLARTRAPVHLAGRAGQQDRFVSGMHLEAYADYNMKPADRNELTLKGFVGLVNA